MQLNVETSSPPNTMTPIGPYSHIAKAGQLIMIGRTAGVDPQTGELVGVDVTSQTEQFLDAFKIMLESVGSDLGHVLHINVFLTEMENFAEMNAAYTKKMGVHRPARTAVAVISLPKDGGLLTMNLTAVANPDPHHER
ncbi:MAG: RidA family protein [Alphaproteobacteria bacterium]|nr:RidA family protein [Alphaproteobacteria bacterium]